MAILFLNADGGDVARLGRLRLWADRGLVHVEDERTGEYDSMSKHTALLRTNALSDMIKKRRDAHTEDQFDRARRQTIMAFVERMAEVCAKCEVQGMPDDPSAVADKVRRLPLTVAIPNEDAYLL